MSRAADRFEIVLERPMPATLRDVLDMRYAFDPADGADPRSVIIHGLDQASLRAVLSLLWDSGLTVVSAVRMGETDLRSEHRLGAVEHG